MNPHLTDEEILDLLAPGVDPDSRVRAHLATCDACRTRIEEERPLAERLSSLPREKDPPRDLWPDLRGRIAGGGERRSFVGYRPAVRAAAAIGLFLLGAAAGRWSAPDSTSEAPAASDDPLAAAAAVQRAGTDYVAAVARFRATSAEDAEAAAQAREATLATVLGAAWELSQLAPDDPEAREIALLVSRRRLSGTP